MSDNIEIDEILELIPHRYPFLLVDKVIDYKEGESCIGIKNLTYNEGFFQGHFPNKPVMPGVLIIEAMAQTASVLVSKQTNKQSGSVVAIIAMMFLYAMISFVTNLAAPIGVIWKNQPEKVVKPGDKLEMFVKIIKNKLNIWFFEGKAFVNGDIVAEAEFSAKMIENK